MNLLMVDVSQIALLNGSIAINVRELFKNQWLIFLKKFDISFTYQLPALDHALKFKILLKNLIQEM